MGLGQFSCLGQFEKQGKASCFLLSKIHDRRHNFSENMVNHSRPTRVNGVPGSLKGLKLLPAPQYQWDRGEYSSETFIHSDLLLRSREQFCCTHKWTDFQFKGAGFGVPPWGTLHPLSRPYLTWPYTGNTATLSHLPGQNAVCGLPNLTESYYQCLGFQLLHENLWPPSGATSWVPPGTTLEVRPCPLQQSRQDWTCPDASAEWKGLIRLPPMLGE